MAGGTGDVRFAASCLSTSLALTLPLIGSPCIALQPAAHMPLLLPPDQLARVAGGKTRLTGGNSLSTCTCQPAPAPQAACCCSRVLPACVDYAPTPPLACAASPGPDSLLCCAEGRRQRRVSPRPAACLLNCCTAAACCAQLCQGHVPPADQAVGCAGKEMFGSVTGAAPHPRPPSLHSLTSALN